LNDYGPDEFAQAILTDLQNATITSTYLVGYSMGGLIVRSMAVNNQQLDVLGALFVAAPLSGETMERQIRRDVGGVVVGF